MIWDCCFLFFGGGGGNFDLVSRATSIWNNIDLVLCATSDCLLLLCLVCARCTVDYILTNTSIGRTPRYNGHLDLVSALLYSLYLTLWRLTSFLDQHLVPFQKVTALKRIDCIVSITQYGCTTHHGPVTQRVDNTNHWINLNPVDNAIVFPNTYPLESGLTGG